MVKLCAWCRSDTITRTVNSGKSILMLSDLYVHLHFTSLLLNGLTTSINCQAKNHRPRPNQEQYLMEMEQAMPRSAKWLFEQSKLLFRVFYILNICVQALQLLLLEELLLLDSSPFVLAPLVC